MSDAFVTIPNVELMTVGEWNTAAGSGVFTMDDVAACVAAQDDPGFVGPRLKLGHTDPRFDGEPCFGKVTNLRASADGQTLIGDLEGIPGWLADIMPTAYPTRSIEAKRNAKSYTTGREYPMVLTALALLGVQAPAVTTLADLRAAFAPASKDTVIAEADIVSHEKETRMPDPQAVMASANIEDVRRAFYDAFEQEHPYWWCRTIMLDPTELIVDDDNGGLYRVPFTVSDSTVTFGDPTPVRVEYVDAPADSVAASASRPAIVFASRSESRPVNENDQEDSMDLTSIATRLGLADDATEDAVLARIDELTPADAEVEVEAPAEAETTVEEPVAVAAASAPEGTTIIDTATLDELRRQAAMGVEARERQMAEDRDALVSAAVASGKIPPSRRDYWTGYLTNDPEGGAAVLASLAEGSVPVVEKGNSVEAAAIDDAYPANWFGGRLAKSNTTKEA